MVPILFPMNILVFPVSRSSTRFARWPYCRFYIVLIRDCSPYNIFGSQILVFVNPIELYSTLAFEYKIEQENKRHMNYTNIVKVDSTS